MTIVGTACLVIAGYGCKIRLTKVRSFWTGIGAILGAVCGYLGFSLSVLGYAWLTFAANVNGCCTCDSVVWSTGIRILTGFAGALVLANGNSGSSNFQ